MANLIIKPTSGGSLILQDEGGTAAHTIDASGNHTLSGTTNNLGTVTAGSLGPACFPSGHVLQAVHNHSYTQTQLTGSGEAEAVAVTFNRKIGSSHFLCSGTVYLGNRSSTSNMDGINPGLRWELNGTDVSQNTNLGGNGFYFTDVPGWWGADVHNATYDTWNKTNSIKLTLSGSANDSVNISIDVFCGADGMWVNRSKSSNTSGGVTSILVMEVV